MKKETERDLNIIWIKTPKNEFLGINLTKDGLKNYKIFPRKMEKYVDKWRDTPNLGDSSSP